MMPELTLYRANESCAFVPHAILLHYGIPAKTIRMKFGPDGYEAADGSFTQAEYRSIHSSGYVPALIVDEEVVTELPAVVAFISSLIPERNLMGREGLDRARVSEWLNWLSGTVHGLGFAMIRRPNRFSNDETTFESIRAKGMEVMRKCFDRIESRMEGKEWAVGNAITAVDFYLYIFLRWGKEIGIDMEKDYPVCSQFGANVEKLEGIKKALEVEESKFCYV